MEWLFYTVECELVEQTLVFHYLNSGKNGVNKQLQ